jgi:hypothetical protein
VDILDDLPQMNLILGNVDDVANGQPGKQDEVEPLHWPRAGQPWSALNPIAGLPSNASLGHVNNVIENYDVIIDTERVIVGGSSAFRVFAYDLESGVIHFGLIDNVVRAYGNIPIPLEICHYELESLCCGGHTLSPPWFL